MERRLMSFMVLEIFMIEITAAAISMEASAI
jgi:hypothetical protein